VRTFSISPARDVLQNGDMTLDVATDLSNWQLNGRRLYLAFRADRNLTVNPHTEDLDNTGSARGCGIAFFPNMHPDLRVVAGAGRRQRGIACTVAGAAADVKIAGSYDSRYGTGETPG